MNDVLNNVDQVDMILDIFKLHRRTFSSRPESTISLADSGESIVKLNFSKRSSKRSSFSSLLAFTRSSWNTASRALSLIKWCRTTWMANARPLSKTKVVVTMQMMEIQKKKTRKTREVTRGGH